MGFLTAFLGFLLDTTHISDDGMKSIGAGLAIGLGAFGPAFGIGMLVSKAIGTALAASTLPMPFINLRAQERKEYGRYLLDQRTDQLVFRGTFEYLAVKAVEYHGQWVDDRVDGQLLQLRC